MAGGMARRRFVPIVMGYGAAALGAAVFLPDAGWARAPALGLGVAILALGATVHGWLGRFTEDPDESAGPVESPAPANVAALPPPAEEAERFTAPGAASLPAAPGLAEQVPATPAVAETAPPVPRSEGGLRADPAFRLAPPPREPALAPFAAELPPETAAASAPGLRRPRRVPAAQMARVREALHQDRIEVALQPIVSLPQRKVRYFECFGRLRTPEGERLAPSEFLVAAEHAGLITAIDNTLLLRSIQLLRAAVRRHESVGFFLNLSPYTLRDQAFMTRLIEDLAAVPDLTPRLAFELHAEELAEMQGSLQPPIDRLARLGLRFSLDDVGTLSKLDLPALEQCHIRFLKIDAEVLLAEAGSPKSDLDIAGIRQQLDRQAIDLIVSRIETEAILVELLDLPIDFGQGLLFGEPRPS